MRKNIKRKTTKLMRVFKRIFLFSAIVLVACAMFLSVKLYQLDSWSKLDADKILSANQTLILYDSNNVEIQRLYSKENRIPVKYEDLPKHVVYAFVSAEDVRFFSHPGIDIKRILGAAWADLKAGSFVQGASTITQQLIKLSHLTPEKKISRKLEEAILACRLESEFSKEEILEMYLNYVYFGRGYYGIEAASEGYFGKSASEMTLAEAATLAAIVKSPSNYAPHLDKEACLRRRNLILDLMHKYESVSFAEATKAKQETLLIKEKESIMRDYFINYTLNETATLLGIPEDEVLSSGYRVYTTLEPQIQDKCEEIFADSQFFPDDTCQGGIAVLGCKNGSVVALVGGRGEDGGRNNGFNRATDIKRQPGSVIKPIIAYAPALENRGYTAATMVLDEKTSFADYSPNNHSDKYHGWVTLREAVKLSLNIPAVKVMSEVGIKSAKTFASSLGIEFDDNDTSLTLALGGFTYGVSPFQVANAYSAFAAGGVYQKATTIRKICNSQGDIIYENSNDNVRIMSEQNAFILTSMLRSVVLDGTGKRLNISNVPLAGKTGTVGGVNSNRDAWMAAYNPEYSACVWIGHDNPSEDNGLSTDVSGGKFPAEILKEVFGFIYKDSSGPAFMLPGGLKQVELDLYTLKESHDLALANAFTPADEKISEFFIEGTEPKNVTEYWSIPEPAKEINLNINKNGIEIRFFAPKEHIVYTINRKNQLGDVVLINSFSGVVGEIIYTDTNVYEGETYSYEVTAQHPQMEIGGKSVYGPVAYSNTIHLPIGAFDWFTPKNPYIEIEIDDAS